MKIMDTSSPSPVVNGIVYQQHPPVVPDGSGPMFSGIQRIHVKPDVHHRYADAYGPSLSIMFPALSKNHNNYATAAEETIGLDPLGVLPIDPAMAPVPSPPYPGADGEMSQPSGLNVRAEEIGLVLLVLLLWAGAVALFFNRWGKIRMLEPYQPKFIDAPRGSMAAPSNATAMTSPLLMSASPRPSYPLIESSVHQQQRSQHQHHHQSRQNVSLNPNNYHCCTVEVVNGAEAAGRPTKTASPSNSFHGNGIDFGCPHQQAQRPRQNSVVVFATSHFMTAARRVKSAMDLQTLVLREETEESVHALSCTGADTGGDGRSVTTGAITCV